MEVKKIDEIPVLKDQRRDYHIWVATPGSGLKRSQFILRLAYHSMPKQVMRSQLMIKKCMCIGNRKHALIQQFLWNGLIKH